MNVNKMAIIFLLFFQFISVGCSPIKMPVNNQYSIDTVPPPFKSHQKTSLTLLVSLPDAMGGYQTEQMLYTDKPYELSAFVHNAWVSSPANMLYSIITQSLQNTGFFKAIASSAYTDKADYRLDTQLIKLKQNFLLKPSQIELVVKVTLTRVADNRVIASKIIRQNIRCKADSPYGGVIAANQAGLRFSQALSRFVIQEVRQTGI